MRSRGMFLLAVTAAAQQAPPTFRSGTELVQVSVVAQDRKGNAVAELRREDFQLFDNGSAQEIKLFVAETEKDGRAEPAVAVANTFTNQIPSTGSRSGYSVLLFDNNGTPFEHTARARIKALQALQAIPAGDKIAIYSLWCKFQVVREFTSDRESLIRQLTAFAPAAGGCGSGSAGEDAAPASRDLQTPGPFNQLAADAAAARARAAAESSRVATLLADSISDEEIKQMADHLAGIPGRKNLIWLAAQFPLSRSALQRLINAGVAVYPVDAVGSTVAIESEKAERSAPLRALAAMTGGIAYFDRDDLDVAVREALDDGRVSYTLGFYASGDDKKPSAHMLDVRVSRPGVILRYRTSYLVEPPHPVPPSPVAELVQAMNRPVDATAIAITASAKRVRNRLDLSVSFDVAGLDLVLNEGLWKGKAEVVARFMAADGVEAGDVISQTLTFNLRPATYASLLKDGASYRREITIPAKAVELKLLVASLASGKIGTLTISLSGIEGEAANAK